MADIKKADAPSSVFRDIVADESNILHWKGLIVPVCCYLMVLSALNNFLYTTRLKYHSIKEPSESRSISLLSTPSNHPN